MAMVTVVIIRGYNLINVFFFSCLIPGIKDCPLKNMNVGAFIEQIFKLILAPVYGFKLHLFAFKDQVTFIYLKIAGYFTSTEEHGETNSHIS